jgi:glutamate-1-semialdehyde aminotransferase
MNSNPNRDPYSDLNPQSRRWWARAQQVVAGGGQAHRRTSKYTLRGAPHFVVRAQGAYFWDPDGRKFLDYLLSYGPIIIGHCDPEVNEAVRRQMEDGTIFSLEHPAVIEFDEELCRTIPCAEMVINTVGGSSATTAAVRCARVHTKREKVVRCGYNGWFDWSQQKDAGAPKFEQELIREVPFNNLDALAAALTAEPGQFAAVVVEAYMDDGPAPGYWDGVRRLCDEHGAVFILDEVKTGFRFALGGAQELFGIKPDLATFSKAMGNGYPGSVVVGKRAILEPRSDTFIGATFHGDLLSIAAARTVLKIMRERDGVAHIARLGRRLMDGINEVFQRRSFPLKLRGWPAMPELVQVENPPAELAGKVITEWCAAMQRRGFYLTGHVWFISLAHTAEDIERTIAAGNEAVTDALAAISRHEGLPYK